MDAHKTFPEKEMTIMRYGLKYIYIYTYISMHVYTLYIRVCVL